ncbi:MAG: lytic transglycosylase domain-containing protein, partial [Ferruginibacter sp.]
MKKRFFISAFIILILSLHLHAQENEVIPDTTKNTEVAEDSMIDEIVAKRKGLEKDKVQYFSQLTRYGFKNLFSKFSYNPLLPYSSQVNPQAEGYMQGYLKVHTNSLLKMKTWGLPYFNLIDNIFAQYGLPRELKYLAVIESNLSTSATSWVGAGGPWQFMPYTAKDYGLVVTPGYDERRDYYKSTNAAARYLLTLYKQLHDWLLVIAAYNGGPGRVFSAMKRSGSKDFWALQYYLPEESRNHVKKFIAT